MIKPTYRIDIRKLPKTKYGNTEYGYVAQRKLFPFVWIDDSITFYEIEDAVEWVFQKGVDTPIKLEIDFREFNNDKVR